MKVMRYEKEKDPMTSEKFIEKYLVSQVSHLGGIAIKYFSPFKTGYPDRLVMLPKGHTIWVELKSTGKKPTKLQLKRHEELRLLGQTVYVCDSKASVDELIEKWKEEYNLPQGRVREYENITLPQQGRVREYENITLPQQGKGDGYDTIHTI